MSLSEKIIFSIIFSRLFHCSIIKVLTICFRLLKALSFRAKPIVFSASRFVVSLPRQQILSYQIISCLSTLFKLFLFLFFKVSVASTSYISYQTVRRLSTLFFMFFAFFIYERFSNLNHDKKKNRCLTI